MQASQAPNRRNHERRGDNPARPNAEQLIRETQRILERFDVRFSPSKVSREVRTYLHRVADKGVPFALYLRNCIEMHQEAQQELDAAYDCLTYADPTGNAAARNIDRDRGAA